MNPADGAPLRDVRAQPLGPAKWSGNSRWLACETETPFRFVFQTHATTEHNGDLGDGLMAGVHTGRHTLFSLETLQAGAPGNCVYLADGTEFTGEHLEHHQRFPWGEHGALLTWKRPGTTSSNGGSSQGITVRIGSAATCGRINQEAVEWQIQPNLLELHQGTFWIVFLTEDLTRTTAITGGHELHFETLGPRLAVAFHQDRQTARETAQSLLEKTDQVLLQSQRFWREYLESCEPNLVQARDLDALREFKPLYGSLERLRDRGRWHAWAVLVNVADLPFDGCGPHLSPDRSLWFGSWSNDTPNALRVLSRTNMHPLARRCLLEYVRSSLSASGDLSWYTHAYSVGCLGHHHDVGRYSHGVPDIVCAIEDYIVQTGDGTILEADVGEGEHLWERLIRYAERVFEMRDVNNDGMIEWANLWETGWDDKASAFYEGAPFEAWIKAMAVEHQSQFTGFLAEHARPTAAVGEQVLFLNAFNSLHRMALKRGEAALAERYKRRVVLMLEGLELRHWDEASGYYLDWDVRSGKRFEALNLDGAYGLGYVTDPQRVRKVVAALHDPQRFGLRFPPTLSSSEPAFDPRGYWRGAYWPREMQHLGRALCQANQREFALRLVVQALMSQDGCVIAEHLEPRTGELLGSSVTMAYSGGLNLALREVLDAMPDSQRRTAEVSP